MLLLKLSIVGLSAESLQKIPQSYAFLPTSHATTYALKFILQLIPSYALPLNQEEPLYLDSLLILGRSLLFMLPQGDQLLLFVTGESFVASNHFIRIIIILVMLVTSSIFTKLYYVPTQLRQQVQPNLQKHEVSHIRITEAFHLYTYQIPRLNYKQETYTLQHLARDFVINPRLLHNTFHYIQGFNVSFKCVTYPTATYSKLQKQFKQIQIYKAS